MPPFITSCFMCMMGFNLIKDLIWPHVYLHCMICSPLGFSSLIKCLYCNTIQNFIDHIYNLLQCFCMLPSFMRELIRMIRACLDAMPVLKVTINFGYLKLTYYCNVHWSLARNLLQTSMTTETEFFFVLTWPQMYNKLFPDPLAAVPLHTQLERLQSHTNSLIIYCVDAPEHIYV